MFEMHNSVDKMHSNHNIITVNSKRSAQCSVRC